MIEETPPHFSSSIKLIKGEGSAVSQVDTYIEGLPANTPITGSCVNYVTTICNKCRKFAPLNGPQIDGYIVCQSCFDEDTVIDHLLPCPYKDPRKGNRTRKAKIEPHWSYTHSSSLLSVTTKANT